MTIEKNTYTKTKQTQTTIKYSRKKNNKMKNKRKVDKK
jgi:hypothetical protein